MACIYFIFHIRRFRYGLPFIEDPEYYDVCIIASVEIFCTVAILQTPLIPFSLTIIYLAILLSFSLLAFFWIRKSIKRKYKDSLKNQEIRELNNRICNLQNEKNKLSEEVQRLSSIIHKDNKLLNAMLLSVDRLISETAGLDDPSLRKEKCGDIRAQLQEVAGERAKELSDYEFTGHRLPTTDSRRIDNLLAYINRLAYLENILFEMSVDRRFMPALTGRISEEDFSTLLADLLENAVIATRPCKKKNILLSLDLPQGFPVVAVYDSGIPFPEEVRAAWGKQRVTTHADSGGSGIGMMTAYDICTKNRAEFQITDTLPGEQFTKCISISFPYSTEGVSK